MVVILPCALSCSFDDPNCEGSGLGIFWGFTFVDHQSQVSNSQNSQDTDDNSAKETINGKTYVF